jgi:hypothetical protein
LEIAPLLQVLSSLTFLVQKVQILTPEAITEHSLKCALQTCNVTTLNLGIFNPGQIDPCCHQLDCKNGGTMDYIGVCYCRCKPPFAGKECEDPYSQVLCSEVGMSRHVGNKVFFYVWKV